MDTRATAGGDTLRGERPGQLGDLLEAVELPDAQGEGQLAGEVLAVALSAGSALMTSWSTVMRMVVTGSRSSVLC
jgi:hypothetical protein